MVLREVIHIKKFLAIIAGIILLFSFVGSVSAKPDNHDNDNKDNHDQISCTKSWNLTGTVGINLIVTGDPTVYLEVTNFVQTGTSLTGSFKYNGGSEWDISSGTVIGNNVNFDVFYVAVPSMTAHFTGVIAIDGSISGTWKDVTGWSRTGTWSTNPGSVSKNLPTIKDQCKKDGWKDFGVFKNQGQCVSYVERCSKDNDEKSCHDKDVTVNPAQLTVHVTYFGDWFYTANFIRNGTHLTGSLTDGYVQPNPLTGPILNGSIVGNHVVFSFDYGTSSVQGVRTYDGTIQTNGDLSGTWSQTGSQSTGQSFPFIISGFAIQKTCHDD